MPSHSYSRFLLCIVFAVTGRKYVSDAFLTIENSIARIKLSSELSPSALAFHQRTVDENEFRTPADSFTFTRYAKASVTSEYVQSDWKDNDNSSKRLSYLDVISSAASCPGVKRDTEETNTTEDPLAEAHRIQQAYREWCEFYGKVSSKERLGVFASNFLTVEEFHKKTGRPLVLNEFADLTEEEYRQGYQSSVSDDASTSAETNLVEVRIREAYRQWCHFYERSYDEKRLRTFAANFVAVEKYHLQTKKSLVLNEFADMTEREYRDHLATAAHFTTPDNIGPRASDDSPFINQQKEDIKPNNDPITSYLDPDPSPMSSHADTLEPPLPNSQTQKIESNSNISASPEPTVSMDALSATNKVIATLQKAVASLSSTVESLVVASQPVASQPPAEPLDTLVIDLLQQQDGSISHLEESVEGLHEIQKQSSDLIELVSNNQKQMTDMMESVQFEFAALQQDQQQVEENYALLLNRIENLEAVVEEFDSNDPVLKQSLVISPDKRVELKPNIPPVGLVMPCINP